MVLIRSKRSDQRDRTGCAFEGQQSLVVFEQNQTFLGQLPRQQGVVGMADKRGFARAVMAGKGIIEQAQPLFHGQNPQHGPIKQRLVQGS